MSRNIDTEATIEVEKESDAHSFARVTINSFQQVDVAPGAENYFLNLKYSQQVLGYSQTSVSSMAVQSVPLNFTGTQSATFRARAQGTAAVRFAVWLDSGGRDEKWVSEPITLSADWRSYQVDLLHLRHMTRTGKEEAWHTVGNGAPESVPDVANEIGFEMGDGINDIHARGHIDLGDILIE
jgi:hypothetical protein